MYTLHPEVSEFAKNLLKNKLSECTEKQQKFFVRLYSHKDISKTYEEVVDLMNDKNVNSAIYLVERTTLNNNEIFL